MTHPNHSLVYETASRKEEDRYSLYTQLLNGGGALVAIILGIWILSSPERRSDPNWLYYLVWTMATVHTIEEYIFPGGFVTWFNRVAFQSDDAHAPLSAKHAFFTDGIAALCFIPIFTLVGRNFLPLIFTITFLLLINAFFHICETIKTGKYSPGVITSLLVYVPGLSYIIYFYSVRGLISPLELAVSGVLAVAATAAFFTKVRGWQREARTAPTNA